VERRGRGHTCRSGQVSTGGVGAQGGGRGHTAGTDPAARRGQSPATHSASRRFAGRDAGLTLPALGKLAQLIFHAAGDGRRYQRLGYFDGFGARLRSA